LIAAAIEWQTALPRGLFHVMLAAVLGFVTAGVLSNGTRLDLDLALTAVCLGPITWVGGSVLGVSSYRNYPAFAVGVLLLLELGIAALLIVQRGPRAAPTHITPPSPRRYG
jgi:hypothetical protein